jgi:hypothetical protein
MTQFVTRYLNRSGLSIAAGQVVVGAIFLFKAYRRHDPVDAIVVVLIFFIAAPAFVLWARRLPSTDRQNEDSSLRFR